MNFAKVLLPRLRFPQDLYPKPFQSEHQHRIELLMKLAGQTVQEQPILPDSKVLELRARLILEECLETIKALGFVIEVYSPTLETKSKHQGFSLTQEYTPNLIEIADGCADISVVTIGTLSACGIKDSNLLKVVDENNLEKFTEVAVANGAGLNEQGKWIKASNHKKVNLEEAIFGIKIVLKEKSSIGDAFKKSEKNQ